MDRLWTPWRMNYIRGKRVPGCIFCNAAQDPDNPDLLVVHTGERGMIMLNRYPYNSGHLMVVPYEHQDSPERLDAETRAGLMELSTLAIEVCRVVYRCDGFNTGMNIGQAAGAGIADHLHLHVVPRWIGDANFMPMLGNTLVLPETLNVTHARLRGEFATHIARTTTDHQLAAGALVYLPERNAFVLRKLPGHPAVVPKGKIEEGETASDAAIRELMEETGIDCSIIGWLGTQVIPPPQGKKRHQHAVFFLATGVETEEFASHLDADTTLVEPEHLLETIEIPELRDLLESAWPSIRLVTGTGPE